MEEDDEDEEDDHEDDGTWGRLDTEKSDETNNGKIGASGGLLQSSRVDKTLGIDIGAVDEKKVIAEGHVD